jgi:hypothetical protein
VGAIWLTGTIWGVPFVLVDFPIDRYGRYIPHQDLLRDCMAEAIAMVPRRLTGMEILFLCKHLRLRPKDVRKIFNVSESEIQAWNDGRASLTPTQEAGLRRSVLGKPGVPPPHPIDVLGWVHLGMTTDRLLINASTPPCYKLLSWQFLFPIPIVPT